MITKPRLYLTSPHGRRESVVLIAEWCFSERGGLGGVESFQLGSNAIVVTPPLFASDYLNPNLDGSIREHQLDAQFLSSPFVFSLINQRQTQGIINSEPLSLNVLDIWRLSLLVHIQCIGTSVGLSSPFLILCYISPRFCHISLTQKKKRRSNKTLKRGVKWLLSFWTKKQTIKKLKEGIKKSSRKLRSIMKILFSAVSLISVDASGLRCTVHVV